MICAELEQLEAQLDDIITALEDPGLTPQKKKDLEAAYEHISREISLHQESGHKGGPCYEE